MAEKNQIKLVEITEPLISIQNDDATYFEHLVEIDAGKLAHYKQMQHDFQRMQNELLELIEKNKTAI